MTIAPRSPIRFVLPLIALAATLIVLWQGFLILRNPDLPKLALTVAVIIWGVVGAAALFTSANWLVEQLSEDWRRRIQPFIFVGPAMLLLGWFLFLPTLRTLSLSFFGGVEASDFVGLKNFIAVFTEREMLLSFRNNLLWMVVGTSLCVVLGLLVAVLAERSRFETLAKAIVFMPMAISFVGAGVIWRFVYAFVPVGEPQIGLLNAIVTAFGGEPEAWIGLLQPWNNFFLIAVLVWMQTGFAMVIFSAALKGIPEEMLEAAYIDGATEVQTFFQIMVPMIRGTIITVTTTILIFTLKIFDVVIVMTGGQFGTDVVATQFYRQFFVNRNFGYGSAIAIVLFIAVIPVMIYNLRQMGKQEAFV
jgi:alpha-glucoside transport system permease protein